MQQTPINHPHCLFCRPTRPENRFLAKNLFRRLKRQISLRNSPHQQAQKTEGNGFRQLVKILYPHLLRKSEECQHEAHVDSFCNQLQIDSQTFDQACERVANSIAQTNYHLELVVNQIKNVSNSLAQRRIEVELDSSDSNVSAKKGQRKARLGAERELKAGSVRKSQQIIINSSEVQANYSILPISGSQPSISPLSQQNGNQFAFILPYPFFPNCYSIQ